MFYRMISGGGVAAVSRMPEVTSWGSNIPPIKVVFPSLATVDASEIGRNVSLTRHLSLADPY